MILKLHNNNITIVHNEYPEDLNNVEISYEYELGTNNFNPVLYINEDVYKGDNIKVSFNSYDSQINLRVELYNGFGTCVRIYTGTCNVYKLVALGTVPYINTYKEIIRLRKRIKELEEKGDVV